MLQSVSEGLYVYLGSINSAKVAAFDLDWTLVRPIRGKFPKDANDWAWLPDRLPTLTGYLTQGYTLVIFTNQGYTGDKLAIALQRVINIGTALNKENVFPWIIVATTNNFYRKPATGMWKLYESYMMHFGQKVDKSNSFYVGDAAGRPGDFSDSDISFARNNGISFHVPERVFPPTPIPLSPDQSMIITVGMPGSGKTTYCSENLQPLGWVHCQQDILKTPAKMLKAVGEALAEGKSVVVDATNPDPQKRNKYIQLAKDRGIVPRILYLVSNGHQRNNLRSNPVPTIAYNVYYKNLVEPTPDIDGVPVIQRC